MKIPYRTKTKAIDLLNLTPEDICAEDIACSLAGIARFNGITRPLYSVAQHSVLCSMVAPTGLELAALLHDAHEYILGDITGPAKMIIDTVSSEWHGLNISVVSDVKYLIDSFVSKKFNVPFDCDIVSSIDARMLATEMVYFFGKNYTNHEPYENVLAEVWDTDRAENEFLKRLGELTE